MTLRSSHATNDELTLIRDSIMLPHILTMIQRNLDDIEYSGGLLKTLYIDVGQALMDRISRDLFEIKRRLSRAKIKVHDAEFVDTVIRYPYTCRGYEGNFAIIREVLKAEISVRLSQYIADITRALRETKP